MFARVVGRFHNFRTTALDAEQLVVGFNPRPERVFGSEDGGADRLGVARYDGIRRES